MEANLLFIEN